MSAHEHGDTMVDALRRANPVPMREGDSRRATPSAHALFAEIIAAPTRRRSSRTRSRVIVIVIAIILLVLALVAFVAVRKDNPTQPTTAVCYSAADLGARRIVVGVASDAAAACATVWNNGDFAAMGIKSQAPAGYDVCVLPTGVAAVFPGEAGSVCAKLGLPEALAGDKNVAGFAAEADARLDAVCMKFDPAARIVKSELEKWRLDGWTIKRGDFPYTAARPCTAIAVDAVGRQVMVVSYPGPHPSTT